MYLQLYGGQRLTSGVLLNRSLLTGAPLNVKSTSLARLAKKQAPDKLVPLLPHYTVVGNVPFCLRAGGQIRSLCGTYLAAETSS